ncbi:MAG TPA: ribosomal protein S18-alanine N-acetyltransferase [Tepidiformaceae bacterium]|nr:ribosomal protein S18-alanine N-acetyltransferase [Tepidiformaceae bacterium]
MTSRDPGSVAPAATRPRLRAMEHRDIGPVVAIEEEAFTAGWPKTAYERELTKNQTAHYLVLDSGEDDARLIGFAGMWCILDEAHVVTVAVPPELQGNGYGRLLVHALVDRATDLQMSVATLECRVSNTVARALYRDYGFYEVGMRKAYYSDNREDAVIMTTEELTSTTYRERFRKLEERLGERFPGVTPRIVS